MTANEYYELAKSSLNGENGAAVDKEKGLEYLKLAAESGHIEASILYAKETVSTDAKAAALLLSKNLQKPNNKEAFVSVVLACAKQNPDMKDECLAMLDGWVSSPEREMREVNKDYAELLAIASPDKADEIKTRYRIAAMSDGWFNLDSNLVFDPEILEKYNFDNKLISPKDMMSDNERLKKDEIESQTSQHSYKGCSNRFVKIQKSEEYAGELVKNQFVGSKPTAADKISDSAWAKMKDALPEPKLVYEKLRGILVDIGESGYRFQHQAHNSVTIHNGTGKVVLDSGYGEFAAAYICEKQDDDLMQYVNSFEYCDLSEVPQGAMIRAGARPIENKQKKPLYTRMNETLDAIVASRAKDFLLQEYGWFRGDIEVYRQQTQTLAEYNRAVYVPYYYYIFDIDGDKITIRVNAFDGAISYFVNNEYGQALSSSEKKALKKAGKSTNGKKKKKFKGWMIPIIIGGAIVAIGILSSFITGFIEGMQM